MPCAGALYETSPHTGGAVPYLALRDARACVPCPCCSSRVCPETSLRCGCRPPGCACILVRAAGADVRSGAARSHERTCRRGACLAAPCPGQAQLLHQVGGLTCSLRGCGQPERCAQLLVPAGLDRKQLPLSRAQVRHQRAEARERAQGRPRHAIQPRTGALISPLRRAMRWLGVCGRSCCGEAPDTPTVVVTDTCSSVACLPRRARCRACTTSAPSRRWRC